jgi:hypothetical protein
VEGRLGGALFACVAALMPAALIAAAASRRGAAGRHLPVLLGLTLTLEAGTLGILWLGRPGAAGGPVAGLPPAAWVMLIVLGLVPLLLIPASYAASFEDDEPDS